MNEINTTTPGPVPGLDPQPAPGVDPVIAALEHRVQDLETELDSKASTQVEAVNPDALSGFAVYDDTYLKFAPGVYESKADATKAAKAAKIDRYTVRAV